VGVLAVRGVAGMPEVLKASGVIRELGEELRDRVVGGRRLRSPRIVAVGRGHVVKLLDIPTIVK
jgi:hypothetical protein